MACVEIPVPDSRKKVDELFLFWLSEPSTQEMLRKELSKVRGHYGLEDTDEPPSSSSSSSFAASTATAPRPKSPVVRSPSPPPPPPLLSRSPKSPRSKPRPQSPRKTQQPLIHRASREQSPPTAEEKAIGFDVTDTGDVKGRPATAAAVEAREESGGAQDSSPAQPHDPVDRPRSCSPMEPEEFQQPVGATTSPKSAPPEMIPRFYFPHGRPKPEEETERQLRDVGRVFQRFPHGEIPLEEFHMVAKALGLPFYWRAPLFLACTAKNSTSVGFSAFKRSWQRIVHTCHDDVSRFVRLMAGPGRNYITEDDFEPLVQDIVDCHPGLTFLAAAPEFHTRYIETVISRIFYVVNKSWNGQITAAELRKSNFLETLALLEEKSDINEVTDYFSYEHFYVIYCKFWELDTDHDLIIDAQDLSRHSDHALTPRVVQRVLSGVVSRDRSTPPGKLSYKDFIWFLLSEEDKTTPRSIEYWFRCLDIDGDGVLSLFELVYFYEEVLQKLLEFNIDCLSIENAVCQVLDMINPREPGKITLRELKTSKLAPVFFNTFVNVEKYLDYEQRDPVAAAKLDESEEAPLSDWDRYAADQYEVLVQEDTYEQEQDHEFEDEEAGDSELEEEEQKMLEAFS